MSGFNPEILKLGQKEEGRRTEGTWGKRRRIRNKKKTIETWRESESFQWK
jgi:hypothetical protein